MKSADSPSKFIPFASMTLLLSPLSLIMVKLRVGCLQISLEAQQSQHWRLACNGKHQVEHILSGPCNLKTCRTGCRDGSKWMWHLYLLVFIQTSCVPLRSLHIRKCWRLPSHQRVKLACVWSLFISTGCSYILPEKQCFWFFWYSAHELWCPVVFCMTVNKRWISQSCSSFLPHRYMLTPSNHME